MPGRSASASTAAAYRDRRLEGQVMGATDAKAAPGHLSLLEDEQDSGLLVVSEVETVG